MAPFNSRVRALRQVCLSLWLCAIVAAAQAPPAPPHRNPETIGAAPDSQILPPRQGYHFPNGETWVFSAEWHMINAGTATLKMDSVNGQQRIGARADSAGVVNALYKVRDQFESLIDPRTFCSVHLFKHTEEGSRKRETNLTLDYNRRKSVLEEKNLKTNETKRTENDLPACATDVISGFYYLSSLSLDPGSTTTFPINDGKTTHVRAIVDKREQIKVPAGTFQTVRVSAQAISGPLKGKGNIQVWFTDDQNHTPVQMKSTLGWGSLFFRLIRLEKPTP
jgi:uncharacterized protein DUF3108